MIEESTTSRNCTAHSSSSRSLPRRVASSDVGWAVTTAASETGLLSTVLRLAVSGPISTELAELRPHLPEPRLHRDAQRPYVLAGLAEHHPALDAGQQPGGQLGGLGVRAQFPALAHPLQCVRQQPLPGVEPGGGLQPRVLVAAGDLGRQRPDRAPWQPRLLELGGETCQRLLQDRKSTRLNSSHVRISYDVFCLKK